MKENFQSYLANLLKITRIVNVWSEAVNETNVVTQMWKLYKLKTQQLNNLKLLYGKCLFHVNTLREILQNLMERFNNFTLSGFCLLEDKWVISQPWTGHLKSLVAKSTFRKQLGMSRKYELM